MKHTLYSSIILDKLRNSLSGQESQLIYDYKGRTLTGSEVLRCVERAALELAEAGVRRGDRVVFLVRPSIEAIIYFFALLRAGAVVVLADPEMGQENFSSRIKFSEAAFLLQDEALATIEKYPFIKPLLRLCNISFPENLPIEKARRLTAKSLAHILQPEASGTITEEAIADNEDMAIIFTSGTVAAPKGVVHSYASLNSALGIIASEVAITENDFLYASQLYFLLIGLMVSARTFIPRNGSFSPTGFLRTADRLKLTSAFLLPYEGELLRAACRKQERLMPEPLKTLLFGSAPVTKGFLNRFSAVCRPPLTVYGVYGATEMLPIALIEMSRKMHYQGEGDVLGTPVPGVGMRIAADGEILLTGPQLFVRYLGDAEKARYFPSGDLGKIDAQGNLVLLGRKKDMIIRRGYNVYPALFEASIAAIPGVLECCLVGAYDAEAEDEKIVLFIVSEDGHSNNKSNIARQLASGPYSIDAYARPDEIACLPSLPRSGRSKKIDKKALRSLARKILCLR